MSLDHSLLAKYRVSGGAGQRGSLGLEQFFLSSFPIHGEPQGGTKVLRHFRKMAPFCIVDIPIPFPCLPQPLPPKINVVFWTLKSFFYFRQH